MSTDSPAALTVLEQGAPDEASLADGFDDDLDDDLDDESVDSTIRSIVEWLVVVVGAVAIALVVRAFLFQPFWIPSESMEQTLLIRDRVMVNKLSYRLGDIEQGDVVVFRPPAGAPNSYENLIKRVIGRGGDVVEGHDGAVFVNGVRLDEPYLDPADVIFDFEPITVPEGDVFLMGDNRDDSFDSRFFGTVPEENVVGRAFVVFWPLSRIDTL